MADVGQVQMFSTGRDGPSVEARTALAIDGVVGLRQAVEPNWLALIEEGIAAALDGASADVDVVRQDGDGGRFSFSSGAWQSVPQFRRFIFDSPVAHIVWPLLDSEHLTLFYDFLLIKEAHSDSATTPWHQDHSYYPLDGYKVVNSWIALDDIPVRSALRFARGSHLSRVLYRAVDFDNPTNDYRHARTELPLPPGDVDGVADILVAPMRAGDMLVWSSYTLHSAPGNRSPNRRAAFSINWVGDDVTYNGKAALDTYVDSSLVAGDPIGGDKFPVVRGVRREGSLPGRSRLS